jgi:hypothetical protein
MNIKDLRKPLRELDLTKLLRFLLKPSKMKMLKQDIEQPKYLEKLEMNKL